MNMNDFVSDVNRILDDVPEVTKRRMKQKVNRLLTSGTDSFDELLRLIDSQNTKAPARITAIWLAGRLGLKRASKSLIPVFVAGTDRVAWEAAISLGLLKSKRSIPTFLRTLESNSEVQRRIAAAYALGMLGDRRYAHRLASILENQKEDPSLRSHVAEALGRIGDENSVESLSRALDEDLEDVVYSSVYALGQIANPRSRRVLRRFVGRPDSKNSSAAVSEALRILNDS